MRRVVPVVMLAALAGCAGDPQAGKPIDPSLVQATVEVKGMS